MGNDCESPQAQVLAGLQRSFQQKEIPCSLLYDDRGSELYEKITELEEYYPFRVEKFRLKDHCDEIAAAIPDESVIVELGCGTARKSSIILTAVQKLRGRCKFVGIDVSASFLTEARANLVEQGIVPESIDMVEDEYIQGLKRVRAMHPTANLCIMWLGSSVGNFNDAGAIQFFRDISSAVGTRCQIFLCADMWKDSKKLYAAYHDRSGVTELFIKNGMRCALALLNHATSEAEEASWVYEVVVNKTLRRVEMYLTFTEELSLPAYKIHIRRGERVLVEVSRKFTAGDFNRLANEAGFHIDVAWRDSMWGMQMLIPFRDAFLRCWAQTDEFFQSVPDWCEKPIDVRHPFKFYYGHIQAFAKLKLRPNEPSTPTDIMFSRGIDPNVVDPTKCHSHPEVPQEWPTREDIEAYVQKTRGKLLAALAINEIPSRLVILAIEHEYMHLETLAYMRAQNRKTTFEKKMRKTNAPHHTNGAATNGFANGAHPTSNETHQTANGVHPSSNGAHQTSNGVSNGAHQSTNGAHRNFNGVSNGVHHKSYHHTNGARVHHIGDDDSAPSAMVKIAPGKVTLGGDSKDDTFMWDNEYPKFVTTVREPFSVSCKPVTVSQYLTFIKSGGYKKPMYWKPLDFAFFQREHLTTPATWSEIDGDYWIHNASTTSHWSRVANEPVYASLSEAEAYCAWSRGRVMTEAEYQLIITSPEEKYVESLRSGGWEWTSTPFEPFPGFVPMKEYLEYSADFFDGSHYVLKGASPVTHRCMRRDTFRNFYQRQYPYVFAKFRVCKTERN